MRGSSLFVEINRFLLTPLVDTCHSVDKLATSDWKQHLAAAIGSMLVGPIWVVRSVFMALGKLGTLTEHIFDTKERNRRREIERNPIYNYGASRSVRQTFSSEYLTILLAL